jgi:hypothetical protein
MAAGRAPLTSIQASAAGQLLTVNPAMAAILGYDSPPHAVKQSLSGVVQIASIVKAMKQFAGFSPQKETLERSAAIAR